MIDERKMRGARRYHSTRAPETQGPRLCETPPGVWPAHSRAKRREVVGGGPQALGSGQSRWEEVDTRLARVTHRRRRPCHRRWSRRCTLAGPWPGPGGGGGAPPSAALSCWCRCAVASAWCGRRRERLPVHFSLLQKIRDVPRAEQNERSFYSARSTKCHHRSRISHRL